MYRLLIVDDEKAVVDNLALTIPWLDYGIEEVFQAYSAREAIDIAVNHAIDIMITDIRMPGMDGLELIAQIKTHFSRKIRCIILSGHNEFDYAQKAIQYQSINYLLKPVVIDDLIQSVCTAIADIEREWTEISSYQRIQHTLHANLPMLKDQLLNDLIKNRSLNPGILTERLSRVGLTFRTDDSFVMLLVRMEEEFSGYGLKSLSLLEYAVSNIAEEVFQDLFELWHCKSEQGYLVFLVKSLEPDTLRLIDSYAVKLQNHVKTFLKGNLSICMSKNCTFPNQISELYQAMVSNMNRYIGSNNSFFITMDDAETVKDYGRLVNLYEPPLLPSLLEAGNWDEALAKIEHILHMSKSQQMLTSNQLLTAFLYLSSSFTIVFSDESKSLEEELGEEFELMLHKKSYLTRQRLYDWAKKKIEYMRLHSTHRLEDAHQQITNKIRSFIQSHLSEGISLQMIADQIGLHPVYLSNVYKTITGETIRDYIHNLRMERASYLLKNPEHRISDISSQLGFMATPHFNKVFKKHYGCTPQEFRNR